ncbi:hypothetical protein ACFFK0_21775 [Paenibacillus chartarius]|uniref:SbsC C-terminal domain-containing protein n=1 Tax=Paenibacillus chartarius TaxID=747481 RepID=A0ABV6DR36_9BACL
MTKRGIMLPAVIVVFAMLAAPAAYAHVSGVFGDYLAGKDDPGATERLLADLAESRAEMERLSPQLQGMQQEFDAKAKSAKDKLGLYQAIGMDTYVPFILQGDDVVDAMAGVRLLEREVEGDLTDLERLYAEYAPVQAIRSSLSLHSRLLETIQGHLAARDRTVQEAEAMGGTRKNAVDYLSISEWISDLMTEDKEIDPLTHRLDEIWTQNIGYLRELREDGERLQNDPYRFITRKTEVSPYTLEDRLLNEQSPLTYYFLTDHAYVHLQRGPADLLLIGTVSKSDSAIALQWEAGFLNGFAVPDTVLKRLSGFKLDYAMLRAAGGDFIVELSNGSIIIQPVEYLKE